jgi:hypothetical protein
MEDDIATEEKWLNRAVLKHKKKGCAVEGGCTWLLTETALVETAVLPPTIPKGALDRGMYP